MAAHVVMEGANFPPTRPTPALADGRRILARRMPALRSGLGSSVLLGLRFLQARLISVWGLVVAAALCPPAVFAAFAVFSAAASFVATASLLRLEAVFFRDGDAARLGRAFRLACAVGVCFLALAGLVLAGLAAAGRIAPAVALFFFLSLAARSCLRLLWAEATAEGDFRAVGNSNVVQAMAQPFVMLALIGIFGPKALALFMADAFGHVLAAGYLLHRRRTSLARLLAPSLWSGRGLAEAAWRWREAPMALLPAALLAYGFAVAPLLALPYAANALLAAQVALAMRLLDMPTQMFGTVSTPVLMNHLRFHAGPRRALWIKVMTLGLVLAAAGLFTGIALGVHLVEGWLDRTKWAGVGEVVGIMAVFYGGIALVGPLQEIAAVSRRPLGQVAINGLSLAALVGTMAWFGALSPTLLQALGLVSLARTLLCVIFVWARTEDRRDEDAIIPGESRRAA